MTTRQLKRTVPILATGLALLGAGAAHAGFYEFGGSLNNCIIVSYVLGESSLNRCFVGF